MTRLPLFKVRPILRGLKSCLPGSVRTTHTGGTNNARYCYAVWLRHYVLARKFGMAGMPRNLAELGPGDSIGIGLAAVLSGAESCTALDVVRFASTPVNLEVLDSLVDLFQKRARIPDQSEFPNIQPSLESYEFPKDIFAHLDFARALSAERVAAMKVELEAMGESGGDPGAIRYVCPWNSADVICSESVDFIYSQAVLEHVIDAPATYEALDKWLRPGGYMSHVIDFSSHGLAPEWNGHWAFRDFEWRLVKGARPWLLNRLVLSEHLQLMEQRGFRIVAIERFPGGAGLPVNQLSSRFRQMPENDLTTRSAYVLAQKI